MVSVHSLPLFFSRKGLCPLLPVLLPSGIAPSCSFRALAQPFGSMVAPCSPHYLPCPTRTSHSLSFSGCLSSVICSQWWLQSPVPYRHSWILRIMPKYYVFLLTSLPLSLLIPQGILPHWLPQKAPYPLPPLTPNFALIVSSAWSSLLPKSHKAHYITPYTSPFKFYLPRKAFLDHLPTLLSLCRPFLCFVIIFSLHL